MPQGLRNGTSSTLKNVRIQPSGGVQLTLSQSGNMNYFLLMDPDAIVGVIFIAGIVVLVFLIRRVRTAKTVFITDYQRGVRFVNGVFRDVLGPGRYRSYTGHDLINVVDMRPSPSLAERMSYQDALHSPSIMSIGAELLVSDPYVASTKLKNPVDDSIPVAREIIKSFASGNITDARP